MKIYAGLSMEEWLALRTKVITATESATILGLDQWSSVADLTREKSNPTFEGNGYTWVGSNLEPVVVEATNKFLYKGFKLFDTEAGKTMYVDLEGGIGATPDATDGKDLLECKTTGLRNWYKWNEYPPLKYLCQLQVQLYCYGGKVGYLSIMCTDLQQYSNVLTLKLVTFKVLRSAAFEKILKEQVARYWKSRQEDKSFRVDRRVSEVAKLLLAQSYTRVFP